MKKFLVKTKSSQDYYSSKFGKSKVEINAFIIDAEDSNRAREEARNILHSSDPNNGCVYITEIEEVGNFSTSQQYTKTKIDINKPWWEANLIACDVETTGLSPIDDRIIEIAFSKYNKKSKKFEPFKTYLLNDGVTITDKITELTGITNEDIKDKPSFDDKALEFLDILNEDNTILIFHNRGFDMKFILNSFSRFGMAPNVFPPAVCSMEFSMNALPELKKNKLFIVAEHLKVDGNNSHRAEADAMLAGDVFMEMCRRNPQFRLFSIGDFLSYFDSLTKHLK